MFLSIRNQITQKMGKITKRFSITIATLGILCLIWGISISVISFVLAGKTPGSISEQDFMASSGRHYSIDVYWWGGIGVSIKQRWI